MATRLMKVKYGSTGTQIALHCGFGKAPKTFRVKKWQANSSTWTNIVIIPLDHVLKRRAVNRDLPPNFPGTIQDYQWN